MVCLDGCDPRSSSSCDHVAARPDLLEERLERKQQEFKEEPESSEINEHLLDEQRSRMTIAITHY